PGPAPWSACSIEEARKVVVHARRHVPPRYRLAESTLEALAFEGDQGRVLGPRVHPRGARDRLLERLALRGEAEIAWAGVTVTARPAVDARSAYGAHPSGVVALAEGLGGQPRTELAAAAVVEALAAPGSIPQAFEAAKRGLVAIANPREPEWYLGVSGIRMTLAEGSATLAWLGDIGVLRLRDGEQTRIARGHPQVERWIEEGMMTARGTWSPYAVQVNRALTPGEQGLGLEPHVQDIETRPGDRFLLMTSGVSRTLDDPTLLGLAMPHAEPRGVVRAIARTMARLTRDESASMVVVDVG
ncbi:MAG: hypothetical protein AAF602_17405, partial [Myxococcota bacterium]